MKQCKVKILKNINVIGRYFKLSFAKPRPGEDITPGQFIEVKVSNGIEPLLRKPLGIHRSEGKTIEVLYEVVGRGTEVLSARKPGECLDIIGPLGNGFGLRRTKDEGRGTKILVAGGIGVAPLMFLAEKLVNQKPQTENRKPVVLIGVKTKKEVLCEREFTDLGCDVKITTDDGSKGQKGFITDLLKFLLLTMNYKLPTIYACGPKPMLKETANIAKKYRIPCQVLLEEYMACGVGVCLGCAVKVRTMDERRGTRDEYKMVCKDGPVFEASEIIWE